MRKYFVISKICITFAVAFMTFGCGVKKKVNTKTYEVKQLVEIKDSVKKVSEVVTVQESLTKEELHESLTEWSNVNTTYTELKFDSLGRVIWLATKTTDSKSGKDKQVVNYITNSLSLTVSQIDSIIQVHFQNAKEELKSKEENVVKPDPVRSTTKLISTISIFLVIVIIVGFIIYILIRKYSKYLVVFKQWIKRKLKN